MFLGSSNKKLLTQISDLKMEIVGLRDKNLSLTRENERLEALCDETYVARGADAYHHACSELERFQRARKKAGKEVGTEGSLCDAMSWLYGQLESVERELAKCKKRNEQRT